MVTFIYLLILYILIYALIYTFKSNINIECNEYLDKLCKNLIVEDHSLVIEIFTNEILFYSPRRHVKMDTITN